MLFMQSVFQYKKWFCFFFLLHIQAPQSPPSSFPMKICGVNKNSGNNKIIDVFNSLPAMHSCKLSANKTSRLSQFPINSCIKYWSALWHIRVDKERKEFLIFYSITIIGNLEFRNNLSWITNKLWIENAIH